MNPAKIGADNSFKAQQRHNIFFLIYSSTCCGRDTHAGKHILYALYWQCCHCKNHNKNILLIDVMSYAGSPSSKNAL